MSGNDEVIQRLENEKKRLENLIEKVNLRLAKAPEGTVRIQKHGKG